MVKPVRLPPLVGTCVLRLDRVIAWRAHHQMGISFVAFDVVPTAVRACPERPRARRGRTNPADAAMERYAAGDAFVLVYDELAPRLFGFLLRKSRNAARAEHLLQQTFLRIHRARSRFIPGSEVRRAAFAARVVAVGGGRWGAS